MLTYLKRFIWIVLLMLSLDVSAYRITIKNENCIADTVYLAQYYGKSWLPVDTLFCKDRMVNVFEQKKTLDEGLYTLIFGDKFNVDLLLSKQQNIDVTLFQDQYWFARVKDDAQSEQFSEYGYFVYKMQEARDRLYKSYEPFQQNPDSMRSMRRYEAQMGSKMDQYFASKMREFKGLFLGSVFGTLQQPVIPAMLSVDAKRMYLKDHFFDAVDLSDERLTRTPFLVNLTEVYLNRHMEQIPDTLVKYSKLLIDRSKQNPEVFKQVCNSVFQYAVGSDVMGMDKLLVSVSKDYYLTGDAFWVDDAFRKKLRERVRKSEPILLGAKAPALNLMSENEEMGFIDVNDVPAKYTLIFFWEPDCHFCKQAVPVIKQVSDLYSESVFEVYAVCTIQKTEEWRNFIFEHDLQSWIHVYDKNSQSNYKMVYDISATPKMYLLDENKRILAKDFGAQNLEPILKHLLSTGSVY